MPGRESYSYTVLRYVHDIMTGEFVNVGVVLHATSGLRSRFRSTHGRVASVFPGLDEKAFKDALRAVKAGVERIQRHEESEGLFVSPPNATALAQKALVRDDSSLQWSSSGSGVTSDADATLDQIYDRFVTQHEKKHVRRRDDTDIWTPIRARLEELNVAESFQAQTFRGAVEEITLDHAWKNGRWHAIQAVSLDLADDNEIKRKVHRIRGHLDSVADGLLDIPLLNLVLGKPSDARLMSAFHAARTILEKAAFRPQVFDEDGAQQLAVRLADEIHAHEAAPRR